MGYPPIRPETREVNAAAEQPHSSPTPPWPPGAQEGRDSTVHDHRRVPWPAPAGRRGGPLTEEPTYMKLDLRRKSLPLALVTLSLGLALASARPVFPLPTYAARTGLDCRSCHFDPNGGGPRNGLGYIYEKQRHDLTPDPDPRWAELPATNKIGDALFVGTNTRMIYLGMGRWSDVQVSSFFTMQGALDVVLQPHANLAIVMVRDFGEFSGDVTRDLYGLLQDGGGRYYVKAGRIRGVFGLRQDDHTAGTRAGFLNAVAGGTGGFLPYDPRAVASGLEAGVTQGGLAFSASLTNGSSAFANKAQTAGAKLMGSVPFGRLGVSFYDDYETSSRRRSTRWSGFGLARVPGAPDLTVQGEVGFGTDDLANGTKRNLLATYFQTDYRINRGVTVRARYDFSDVFRSTPGNASERFGADVEFTLVPFLDLRLGYREIVPETSGNEHQLLGMVHLYY